MILKIVLLVIGVIGLIALVAFLMNKKRQDFSTVFHYEQVDVLTLEMIVTFFKQPEIIEKLRQDKNLLAVAVKNEETKEVILTCFNKGTNQISSKAFTGYRYEKLDDDLIKMFGDKDMLVLQ
ncbi:MAG: hypothetical protein P1P64_04805 [Treponemataceae bacterium]